MRPTCNHWKCKQPRLPFGSIVQLPSTTMTKPLMMKCGHSANAERILAEDKRIPACVICDCYEIVDSPNLDGRESKCPYCKFRTASNERLAFFKHQPEAEFDSHYCGCRGWD